jgi:outer membrane lipoprotein-sorting protein
MVAVKPAARCSVHHFITPSLRPLAMAAALLIALAPVRALDTNALLSAWLDAQTNLHTWAADFTQTRTLAALTHPLVATGKVWFAEPNRFRWELGQPPQTIAVRQPDQVLVIYPRLKRVERYPLGAAAAGPWRDALALLEAGFPRSRAELEARFRVLAIQPTNALCEVVLQPTAPATRRLMPEIRVTFATNDFTLRATTLKFADGSTLRNEFSNAVLNGPGDPSRFQPELPAGARLIEGGRGGGGE